MGLFRLIHGWRTREPDELSEQLREHERRVLDAATSLEAGKLPKLRERAVSPGRHTVGFGELILADTSAGDVDLVFPPPGTRALGEVIGVCRLVDVNRLRLATRGHIDRVDTDTSPIEVTTPDVRLYVGTTRGWFSLGRFSGVVDILASDATPQPVGTAAAGGSEDYSRADHVHAPVTAAPRQLLVNQGPLNGPVDDAVTMGSNAVLARVGDGDIASLGTSPNTMLARAGGDLHALSLQPHSLPLRGSGDLAGIQVSEGNLVGRPAGQPLSHYAPAGFGLATLTDLDGYVTLTALATTLEDYVTATALTTTLEDYATVAMLDGYIPDEAGAVQASHLASDAVTNSNVSTSAGIALSKLETRTARHVICVPGSSNAAPSSVALAAHGVLRRAGGDIIGTAISTQSLLLRGAGDLTTQTVSEGHLVGRPVSGSLGSHALSSYGIATSSDLSSGLAAKVDIGSSPSNGRIAVWGSSTVLNGAERLTWFDNSGATGVRITVKDDTEGSVTFASETSVMRAQFRYDDDDGKTYLQSANGIPGEFVGAWTVPSGSTLSVPTPSSDGHAANKGYADSAASSAASGKVDIGANPAANRIAIWSDGTTVAGAEDLAYVDRELRVRTSASGAAGGFYTQTHSGATVGRFGYDAGKGIVRLSSTDVGGQIDGTWRILQGSGHVEWISGESVAALAEFRDSAEVSRGVIGYVPTDEVFIVHSDAAEGGQLSGDWEVPAGSTLSVPEPTEDEHAATRAYVSKFSFAATSVSFTDGNDATVTLYIERVGNIVTIDAEVTSTESTSAEVSSGAGYLPAWAIPRFSINNWSTVVTAVNNALITRVRADGELGFLKRNLSSGISNTNWTNGEVRVLNISYTVPEIEEE